MKQWITADWHLGENRMELMGRPFKDQHDMVGHLLREHNGLVEKDDEVIVVGDVCYQKAPEFLQFVAGFAGKKTLIRGNHDRVIDDAAFSKYFDKIIPEGDGLELEIEGIPCWITHYPSQGKYARFNLVGHIHAAWKYQLNMFNIGIDTNHFRPVNLSTIPFHFKAICEFYDDDVWIAYKDPNYSYFGKRGKKGSYFTPA